MGFFKEEPKPKHKPFDPVTMHEALPRATEPRRNRAKPLLTQAKVRQIVQIMLKHDIHHKSAHEIKIVMETELGVEVKGLSRNLNLLSHPFLQLDAGAKLLPVIECDRTGSLLKFGPVTPAGRILLKRTEKPGDGFFN